MNELISIIIPIYNVEKYIKECLDSIIMQTYQNIEIIIVDDGSLDDSASIAQTYSRKDDRIVIYHKENGGLSSARNFGIEKANGEYLHFVDSDDIVSRYMIENLYEACQKYNSKLAMSQFTKELNLLNENKEINTEFIQGTLKNVVTKMRQPNYLFVSAIGKLYHRSIFNELRFPAGVIYEDGAIFLQVIAAAESIVLVSNLNYYYRTNPLSITTNQISKKNLDIFTTNKIKIDFVKNKHPELLGFAYLDSAKGIDFVAMNAVAENSEYKDEIINSAVQFYQDSILLRKNFLTNKWIYTIYLKLIYILYKLVIKK
jgi:glycosyltransferase involved in cell wall biosynthesis